MDVVIAVVVIAALVALVVVHERSVWIRTNNSSSLLRGATKKAPAAEATGEDTEYGGTRLP
jgi:hypothetical protein